MAITVEHDRHNFNRQAKHVTASDLSANERQVPGVEMDHPLPIFKAPFETQK